VGTRRFDPPPLRSSAAPRVGALIRNLKVRSNRPYEVLRQGLDTGASPYTDRQYTLKEIPPAIRGADFIQTANEDEASRGDAWLAFEALLPVRVHIALDTRLARPPAWISDQFRRSEMQIRADHWKFELYSRDFPAGPVELGGNTSDGQSGGKGNYIVVLEPLPLRPPPQPTAPKDVPELDKRDAERGAALFFHGGGCIQCHRLDNESQSLGPGLKGIGSRATAKHIIESMLNPSAVITEGFRLHLVETHEGLVHAGILVEESGRSLVLGLPSGRRLTLDKSSIADRKPAGISAMPSYAAALTPSDVADIAAFLMKE
jgi:putative heme-binding domain-containing protein